MKKLLGLALGMLLASSALAEPPQKRNEFFLGIGDASLIFAMEDVAVTIFTFGAVTYGDVEGGYQIVGGYQRRFGRWASAGVTASYGSAERTLYIFREDQGKVDRRMLTFMADGRAHWLTRPGMDLYSGFAFGVARTSDELLSTSHEEEDVMPAFQLTFIGVRVGHDVGGFLELGAGFNSIVKAGLSGRF